MGVGCQVRFDQGFFSSHESAVIPEDT